MVVQNGNANHCPQACHEPAFLLEAEYTSNNWKAAPGAQCKKPAKLLISENQICLECNASSDDSSTWQAFIAMLIIADNCWLTGCVTVIRESRAAQTLKLAAICYMVICQLSFALMFNVSYFMDGSRPLNCQVGSLYQPTCLPLPSASASLYGPTSTTLRCASASLNACCLFITH